MMKKTIKTIIIILILPVILLPIIAGSSVMVANNCIANQFEKELKNHPLPDETEFVESFSIAGKVTGNGNGIQYYGIMLVTSELSQDELSEYYNEEFEYVKVSEQKSATVNYLDASYGFKHFGETEDTYYSVIYSGSRSDYVSDFWGEILDTDLRGH